MERLEWHYTPKHGSWLNVAEVELSALSRQCLGRRIGAIEELRGAVDAWELDRNDRGVEAKWRLAQFRDPSPDRAPLSLLGSVSETGAPDAPPSPWCSNRSASSTNTKAATAYPATSALRLSITQPKLRGRELRFSTRA